MNKDEVKNAMADMIETASGTWPQTIEVDLSTWIAEVLVENGYRLDPYPNGKSKDELIARIEAVESERDKTRNLLRAEHDQFVDKAYEGTPLTKRNLHAFANPDCPVCTFLAETSSVKP